MEPPPYGLEPPVMPVDGPPQTAPGAGPAPAPGAETPAGRKAHAAAGARTVVLAASLAGIGGLVGGMVFATPKGQATTTNGSTATVQGDGGTSNATVPTQPAPSYDGDRGYGDRGDDDGGSTWSPPSRGSAVPPTGDVGPQFGGPGGMTTSRGS